MNQYYVYIMTTTQNTLSGLTNENEIYEYREFDSNGLQLNIILAKLAILCNM